MSIENGEAKKENLFDYTEEQLLEENVLTHYQILGIEEHTSTDHVKKAYRKASLKCVLIYLILISNPCTCILLFFPLTYLLYTHTDAQTQTHTHTHLLLLL